MMLLTTHPPPIMVKMDQDLTHTYPFNIYIEDGVIFGSVSSCLVY